MFKHEEEPSFKSLNQDFRISPLHLRWVDSGGEYTPEAIQTVIRLIRRDHKTAARSDGSGRFRASLFGDQCDRKKILSYMGEESAPLDLSGHNFTTVGTWGHYRWQLAGLSAGWLTSIEKHVRGTGAVDGITSDGSGFELKTTGEWIFKNLSSPKSEHITQVHLYMMRSRIRKFHIVYENRNSLEFKEFVIHYDPQVVKQIKEKLESLNDHADAGTLPAMLEDCMASGKTMDRCSYAASCVKYPAK